MRLEDAFGQILKRYRKKINITQEALALECGLDRSYMSALERGVRQPTLKTLFKLAEVLKVPPSQMVSDLESLINKSSLENNPSS